MNANDGYALCRAVHAGFRPLVAFLLAHGANPGCKEALSVRIAIRKCDIDLVRMLLERDADENVFETESRRNISSNQIHDRQQAAAEPGSTLDVPGERVRRPKRRKSGKRRRLEDRLEVTTTMLRLAVEADAQDIVELFVSKGARPDMATLQLMHRHDLA